MYGIEPKTTRHTSHTHKKVGISMQKVTIWLATVILGSGFIWAVGLPAQEEASSDGPDYTNGTELQRPLDYREWTFLSSSLNLTYIDESGANESQPELFQNVFVNPSSYRGFMDSGQWPDETVFVLEIRRSSQEETLSAGGQFQSNLVALEAEVKDSRFSDGWAFYDFGVAGSLRDASPPLEGERVAGCIACHTDHTAVERTFVQFYPTLMEIARQKGTVKPGF